MANLVGYHSAREMVRNHTPFDAAVAALVEELRITTAEATATMHAAHESIDWGIDPMARGAART